MDARRSSSRRQYRLLLRVYAAENLRHVSSQGTYCKITMEETEVSRGSARASLKRLLRKDPSHISADPAARIFKTQVQKSPHGKPVWNEKFEIPVFDPACDALTIRVKSARLMSAPAIGEVSVWIRDVPTDTASDRWINLLDNSKRPVGRLRIQTRLVPASALSSREDDDETADQYKSRRASSLSTRSMPSPSLPVSRSGRRGAIIAPPLAGAGFVRRSSGLSRSMLDARASGSTTASDSISSDNSNDLNSIPVTPSLLTSSGVYHNVEVSSPLVDRTSAKSPVPRDTTGNNGRYTGLNASERHTAMTRNTALSLASRGTEELDFLASKYMDRTNRKVSQHVEPQPPPPPPQPQTHEEPVTEDDTQPPIRKASDRSRRSSNCELAHCELVSPTHENQLEAVIPSLTTPPSKSPSVSPSEIKRPTTTTTNSSTGKPTSKDDRSPRTTNTTAASSDDDEPADTVEFDFDTGDVRPSTRLPSHMMRSTVSRCSIATSRIESDDEASSDDSDPEAEDDEMDPDSAPDGPRMVLRGTVTKLLGRDSVNVIMDEDEDEEDDDEFELDPFVFDEFPILDMRDSLLVINDIDCADRATA